MKTKVAGVLLVSCIAAGYYVWQRPAHTIPGDLRDAVSDNAMGQLASEYGQELPEVKGVSIEYAATAVSFLTPDPVEYRVKTRDMRADNLADTLVYRTLIAERERVERAVSLAAEHGFAANEYEMVKKKNNAWLQELRNAIHYTENLDMRKLLHTKRELASDVTEKYVAWLTYGKYKGGSVFTQNVSTLAFKEWVIRASDISSFGNAEEIANIDKALDALYWR